MKTIIIPGDKSISHRAIMMASLAKGTSRIQGFLFSEDCLATIDCFRQLGVVIETSGDAIHVHGVGLDGLQPSQRSLDVGNSGTSIRLLSGILAGQLFATTIAGDESIAKRPMQRVIKPLEAMGGLIHAHQGYPPLTFTSTQRLRAISYTLPMASAQVKSCVLLAGLYAKGMMTVVEPIQTRDHTERMLQAFGVTIIRDGHHIQMLGGQSLHGTDIQIPGDISSAVFFVVAALITPGADVLIRNVGVNPTRDYIISLLQDMGGNIERQHTRLYGAEPVCDLRVRYSRLHGMAISGDVIPNIIDEIPILCLAATQADGVTEISDAQELRVKESDRIATMANALGKSGANICEKPDGLVIYGEGRLTGGVQIETYHDHRVAMTMLLANQVADNPITVDNESCISTSFPTFFKLLEAYRM